MNLFYCPLFPIYNIKNNEFMEANEKSKSVNVEEQQVMQPYFSEYAPVGSMDCTEGIVSEYNRIYRENMLNCILL